MSSSAGTCATLRPKNWEEWDTEELSDWGLDLQPYLEDLNIDDFFGEETNQRKEKKAVYCPHCGKNINEPPTEEKEVEQ